MDQAEGLRKLIQMNREEIKLNLMDPNVDCPTRSIKGPRVISVTSGKGGVGKTNVVANLAFALTQLGEKVMVLDADLGLANIDVLLGLTPQYTIEHLFKQKKSISEILIKGPGGMWILPASSGVVDLVDLNESQKIFLLNEFDQITETIDILLIDTGAGISSNVLYFNMAAQESIVIATPEPTSLTDAYALIKVLSTRFNRKNFMILVNLVSNVHEAKGVYKRISTVADTFLESLSIDYLGFIPFDEKLGLAVRNQRPVLEIFPKAPSSRNFTELAKTILGRPFRSHGKGNLQFFWRLLFQQGHPIHQAGE